MVAGQVDGGGAEGGKEGGVGPRDGDPTPQEDQEEGGGWGERGRWGGEEGEGWGVTAGRRRK